MQWYGEPDSIALFSSTVNYVISGIFLIEAILKLIGLGV